MQEPRSHPPGRLPRWLVIAGSAVIALHFVALGLHVLAVRSGPWPTPMGQAMAEPPAFVRTIYDDLAVTVNNTQYRPVQLYLAGLKMTHNYHFMANQLGGVDARIEVRLKDDKGKTIKTVRFPDEDANFWVRHRQSLLAQALTNDEPVEARPGERIPAPGKKSEQVRFWDMAPDRTLVIASKPEHLVPRDRPVMRPSPWAEVLARSYMRYLCRVHGAHKAELIRHTRYFIHPAVLPEKDWPPDLFEELISNFGEEVSQ